MHRLYITFRNIISTIALVSFLSSCSYNSYFSQTTEPEATDNDGIASVTTDDQDLTLLAAETENNLTQELEALQNTGVWEQEAILEELPVEAKVLYDFPIVHNKQVQMYLDLFQGKQQKQFEKWLARSGKYADLYKQELESANLPLDLIYLSMIESGFNQRAYSRARAVGLWQFMSATGKQYNLRIDKYIDERRDAEKSTKAAVAFLSDLYDDFGDWHLAVAAYNAGPGKIRRGLKKYKVDNFWDLAQHKYLRLETKRYVPKLIAAIIIAKDPEQYGFGPIAYDKPLEFDKLEVGPGLSLDAIALISDQNVKTIKSLNQELRKSKTPLNRKTHVIKIPAGSLEIAQKNMNRLHSMVSTGYQVHIYRSGESLSAICKKYNINKTTLLKVNNLKSNQIASGTRLRIPHTTVTYQLLPEGDNNALAAYKDNLILHKITQGETISKISKKYNVPPELIVTWNGLSSIHKIRAGQQLALYINKQPTTTPTTTSNNNTIVFASNSKRLPTETFQSNETVSWYRVKSGDSLWTISRKFNISPSQIKQWNNLKSNLIHPGVRLKLINV